jgi:hypothetical protein
METDITIHEAKAIINKEGYDAYGKVRIYGVFGKDSIYSGQITPIKSIQHIETKGPELSRIYVTHNDGFPPIKKA